MAERKKYEVVVTPPGVVGWPKLFEPDRKFNADGEYTARLFFDPNDPAWEAFIAKAKQVEEEGYQEMLKEKKKKILKRAPSWLKEETDKDTGEPTGRVYINTKMKASGISKKTQKAWSMRPTVLDAKKNIITKDPGLGSGSVMRLKVELQPWFTDALGYGLSFPLRAAQIVELVKWSRDDSAGFDSDDNGFDSTAGGDESMSTAAAGAGSDPDDDGI